MQAAAAYKNSTARGCLVPSSAYERNVDLMALEKNAKKGPSTHGCSSVYKKNWIWGCMFKK